MFGDEIFNDVDCSSASSSFKLSGNLPSDGTSTVVKVVRFSLSRNTSKVHKHDHMKPQSTQSLSLSGTKCSDSLLNLGDRNPSSSSMGMSYDCSPTNANSSATDQHLPCTLEQLIRNTDNDLSIDYMSNHVHETEATRIPHSYSSVTTSTNAQLCSTRLLNDSFPPIYSSNNGDSQSEVCTDNNINHSKSCCSDFMSCFSCESFCDKPPFSFPKCTSFFSIKCDCPSVFIRPYSCLFRPSSRHRLLNENMLILSVIQLLCGFAAIVLSSVAFIKTVFLYQMATGLWAGILMLVTGFHGLIASRRPVVCTLIGLLILCMLVSLSACVLICVSVAGTIEDGFLTRNTRLMYTKTASTLPKNLTLIETILKPEKSFKDYSLVLATKPSDWADFDRPRLGEFRNTLAEDSSDYYLRTCQIILHLLLLMVGILEASVSLATSIICCRCVCSNSVNFRFSSSRSLRTNIVSFNTDTANQAASILRSGEVNNFVSSGSVLLAIDADLPEQGQTAVELYDQSSQNPQIHSTLIPFLPQLNQHALILTQAGTGSVALTAARAAANLINTGRCETRRSSCSPLATLSHEGLHGSGRRSWIRRNNRVRHRQLTNLSSSRRPRLLFTSFQIPHNQPAFNASYESFPNPPPLSPSSTVVYVMPSPTREEPPMIFPPFPPSYNDSQKKTSKQILCDPLSRTEDTLNQHSHSHGRLRHRARSAPSHRSDRSSFRTRMFYILSHCTFNLVHLRLRSNTSRRPFAQNLAGRSVASTPISVGDRLIQPVLIIGDPVMTPDATEDPPPKYSN